MKVSELKGQPGIDVIDLLNPNYGGWEKYLSRAAMLRDWANHGCAFIRTGASRGNFEEQQTPSGKKVFWKYAPVLDVLTAPKINPLWEEEFKAMIKDIVAANMVPFIFLMGGCDFDRCLDLMDHRHWSAIVLFASRVINILDKLTGGEFLLEDINEAYARPYPSEVIAERQIIFADKLHLLGMPYGRLTCSGIDQNFDKDGNRIITHAEYLQKYAFGDDVNTAEEIFARKGLKSSGVKVADRLYFSMHEISYPKDFERDGYAGRARVNGYANYSEKKLAVRYSTDGARKGVQGYSGIPVGELGEMYRLALQDILHPLAGSAALFSDLPQERVWYESKEVKGLRCAKMVFKETPDRIDVMANMYAKVTGKAPINRNMLPPIVEPEKPVPTPTPTPTPSPEPKPEVKVKPKLITFVKRFPLLSIHYSSWKKSLNAEELKVHKQTVLLTWVVPGGLILLGFLAWLGIQKLISLF